ncbi:MAG: hypothetical protein IPK21_13710 [Haliscomenobacter sp.]|nr:hypothetical protein [Haliscomenobacter sp.]
MPSGYTASPSLLGDYLTDWCNALSKPLVLLLDEVDALYDDVLISTLRQLRDGFSDAPAPFSAIGSAGWPARYPGSTASVPGRIIRLSGRDRRLMSRLSPFFLRFHPKRYVRCWISIPKIPGRFLQRLF